MQTVKKITKSNVNYNRRNEVDNFILKPSILKKHQKDNITNLTLTTSLLKKIFIGNIIFYIEQYLETGYKVYFEYQNKKIPVLLKDNKPFDFINIYNEFDELDENFKKIKIIIVKNIKKLFQYKVIIKAPRNIKILRNELKK